MKLLIITLLTFTSFASPIKESLKAKRNGEYFLALDIIAKEYKYKEPSEKVKRYIESLVIRTGTHYFNTFKDIELRKMDTPSTQLVMAKRNLYLKKHFHALRRINMIPKENRFYPEALLVKGTIEFETKEYKKAFKTYKQCQEVALEREENFKSNVKRYYAVIKETCMINTARIFFNQGKYKKAIKYYEMIPKNSFKWPYTLLQKAWAYYHLKNFNRSLGILMTYDSPLLESYFDPEVETLKALNYYKLCQYQDALKIVKNYYTTYKPRANQLKKVINKGKTVPFYFQRLMKTPLKNFKKKDSFLRNVRTQVTKRIKYNLDLTTIRKIKKEFASTKNKRTKEKLKFINNDLLEQINHYVKISFYRLINNIHKHSNHLFNIRLEILSKVRKQLYRGLVNKNDQRGKEENVIRSSEQDFWEFKKEFWADELGEYTYALDSKCNLKKLNMKPAPTHSTEEEE